MSSPDSSDMDSVVRRHYVLGLRDEIPAPEEPWSVYRHPAECTAEDGSDLRCGGHDCRRADICRLLPLEGHDVGYPQGLTDVATVLAAMTGRGDTPRSSPLGWCTRLIPRLGVSVRL